MCRDKQSLLPQFVTDMSAHGDVLPRAWSRFLELYGWWSQMSNDTFGWLKDSQNNAATSFFSPESRRRKYPDESVTEWVIREGFEWAMETLETWMAELRALSRDLQNPAIVEHLDISARRRWRKTNPALL